MNINDGYPSMIFIDGYPSINEYQWIFWLNTRAPWGRWPHWAPWGRWPHRDTTNIDGFFSWASFTSLFCHNFHYGIASTYFSGPKWIFRPFCFGLSLWFRVRFASLCNGVPTQKCEERYVSEWFRDIFFRTISKHICPNGLEETNSRSDFGTYYSELFSNVFFWTFRDTFFQMVPNHTLILKSPSTFVHQGSKRTTDWSKTSNFATTLCPHGF